MGVIYKGLVKFKNLKLAGRSKTGSQPGEESAYIIDGYGFNLATDYSAGKYDFGTSYRIYALEINADTGSVDMTGDVNCGAIKGRMVIGTTQTNFGASAIVGTTDVGDGVDLISNQNGVCGVLDFYGDTTIGGSDSHTAALVGVVWNEGTTTINAGATASVAGLDLIQNSGMPTLTTGINPAILIRGGTSSRWQYGIYMVPTHVNHALIAGTQPGEETAYIIDGYGINLARDYSAGTYSFGTSYRLYGIEVNADTGGVDMTGDVNAGAIKGRMVIGTTQTNMGASGVVGTLDIASGKNIISNYNGVCGVVDFYGNTTIGGSVSHVAALTGVVWNEATTTLNSAGGCVAGLDLVQNVYGVTESAGINPAILIRASSSTAAWQYGIYITSGHAAVAIAAFDPVNIAITQTSATPGTSRAIYGKQTSHTSMTSGNLVGVRGEVTVGGSVSTGVYLYGAQGKLIGGSNTITAGNGMVCGVYGQIDVTGTTLASGWISAIHADIYGATSGSYAMNLISATHAGGGVINALLSLYGKSDYVFEISSNTHDNVSTSGTVTDDDGYIKVLIDGEARYIGLGTTLE